MQDERNTEKDNRPKRHRRDTVEADSLEARGIEQDWDRLTKDLQSAVSTFREDQTPENFARIVTSLTRFGISGADIWKKFASYTKQHPMRMALSAGLVFFAVKGLMQESKRTAGAYH